MSYIDRDKISLPEVVGRLRDHYNVHDGVLLHWLFLGKELHDGLRVLVDDKVCQFMSDSIMDSGVANIYVEEPSVISVSDDEGKGTYKKKGKAIQEEDSSSGYDSDFRGDTCSSGDDEEAAEILKKFKELKKLKKGEHATLDDIILAENIS